MSEKSFVQSDILSSEHKEILESEIRRTLEIPEDANATEVLKRGHLEIPSEQSTKAKEIFQNPESTYEDFQNLRKDLPIEHQMLEVLKTTSLRGNHYTEKVKNDGPRALERLIEGTNGEYPLEGYISILTEPSMISNLGEFINYLKDNPHENLLEARNDFIKQSETVTLYRTMALSDSELESVLTHGISSPLKHKLEQGQFNAYRDSENIQSSLTGGVHGNLVEHAFSGSTADSNFISFSPNPDMAKYASRNFVQPNIEDNQTDRKPYLLKLEVKKAQVIRPTGNIPSPFLIKSNRREKRVFEDQSGDRIPIGGQSVENWIEFKTPEDAKITVVEKDYDTRDLDKLFKEV